MKTLLILAAPLAAVATLAAAPIADARSPVEPQAKPPRQCFNQKFVNGFAAPDEHNLYVRVGVKDVYHFEMFGPCPEIDWNMHVGLISHGSSFICDGLDAEVVSNTTIGPQRCMVRHMRKLTPAEIAALPKNAKP